MVKDSGTTTLSMWFQGMPALPGRKNVHLTSRQEKLAAQTIRSSVYMLHLKQLFLLKNVRLKGNCCH